LKIKNQKQSKIKIFASEGGDLACPAEGIALGRGGRVNPSRRELIVVQFDEIQTLENAVHGCSSRKKHVSNKALHI
jgi:hypothetical protein